MYVCVLCELGPSEEEERLRAEVKSLKDELDKSRRGTLSSQKGHDGNPYQPISFTDSTYTHTVSMHHIMIMNIAMYYTYMYIYDYQCIFVFQRSSLKNENIGESCPFLEK